MEGPAIPGEGEDEVLRGLMRRYQGGEVEAFEAIYRRILPVVRGYVGAMVRDRSSAEDLVQETFLQAHRSRQTFDPARPFRPWLLGIARHVRLTAGRGRSRRAAHEVDAGEELPEVPVPPEVATLADRDALHRAMARLADDRREAIVLHHVYGLSFREIARVAGVSEVGARVRASRGMSDLREILGRRDG
jgi:RNA polymerase sigma-70 factor (ECF subfamily)